MGSFATVCFVLLALGGAGLRAQDPAYAEEMRKGDQFVQRHQYEEALKAYKNAYALTKKSSAEAALAMAVAYRGLGAHKNVYDIAGEALKLAGNDDRRVAEAHNMRGAALVALSDKPNDKRLQEAETEFRAALVANDTFANARFNLGVTLLKMNRDEEGVREIRTFVDHAPPGPDATRAAKFIEDPRRAREAFAPDFSFTSHDGEYVALEDLKGKTIVIDFWGSWCKPCVMATPGMVKLHKKYAEQGVVFLGIAKDREDDWRRFIEKNKLDWPQYLDQNSVILRQFAVTGYPTYVVLDGDGIIRGRNMGYGSGTEQWLEKTIKDTLKRHQNP